MADSKPVFEMPDGQATPYAAVDNVSDASRDQNLKISWFDIGFFYFGILTYTEVIATPFRSFAGAAGDQLGQSNPVISLCQVLILSVLIFVFVARRDRLLPLLRYVQPFLILVLVCVTSALWSGFPLVTVRRSATLCISVLFGVYCGGTFGLARVGRMLEILALVLGVLSLALYVAVPSIGVDPTIDEYIGMRGVFAQKNNLGEFMLLAIASRVYQLIADRQFASSTCAISLLFICIALSHSVSSAIVAILVLGVGGVFMLRDQPAMRLLYIFSILSVGAILVFVLAIDPVAVFSDFGRDTSLTGRIPLWEAVIRIIAERPVLGHGYGGFWNEASADVQYLWQQLQWKPPGAHSGYLDMALDLGVLGLGLLFFIYILILSRAIRAIRSRTMPVADLALLLMVVVICGNIDETLLANNFSVLLTVAMLELGVWSERRHEAVLRVRYRSWGVVLR